MKLLKLKKLQIQNQQNNKDREEVLIQYLFFVKLFSKNIKMSKKRRNSFYVSPLSLGQNKDAFRFTQFYDFVNATTPAFFFLEKQPFRNKNRLSIEIEIHQHGLGNRGNGVFFQRGSKHSISSFSIKFLCINRYRLHYNTSSLKKQVM